MGCEPIEESMAHNDPVAAKGRRKDDGSNRHANTNNFQIGICCVLWQQPVVHMYMKSNLQILLKERSL